MAKQTKAKLKINISEKVSFVAFKDLKPNPSNENTHDKKQIKLLFNHIKKVGIRKALIVSNDSGFMVTGHGTLEALRLFKDDNLQVPVSFQNFSNEKEEFDHRLADNGLAKLSILNQSQLEINANNLGLDISSYDFGSLGLVDFKSLENQAGDILKEADKEFSDLANELKDLDDSGNKKKTYVELEREVSPSMINKTKVASDIPGAAPVTNVSKKESLSNYKTAYINVLDARMTFMQVRSRELEKFLNNLGTHTQDLILYENLILNFAPNDAKISMPFQSDEFLGFVGACWGADELSYFVEILDVIDGACPHKKIKDLYSRLLNDSFFTIICPNGIGEIARLTDYLQELIEDSIFYIPKSYSGHGFESGYMTNLGYPAFTFVKGSLNAAKEKLQSRKIEHREKDKILKDFYASVVNESDF